MKNFILALFMSMGIVFCTTSAFAVSVGRYEKIVNVLVEDPVIYNVSIQVMLEKGDGTRTWLRINDDNLLKYYTSFAFFAMNNPERGIEVGVEGDVIKYMKFIDP